MSIAAMFAVMMSNAELNGIDAANKAAAEANAQGSAIIFLTKSEYQDLCHRAVLPELRRYKGKTIWIVSDPIEGATQENPA